AFAGFAVEVSAAARCSIQSCVANNDVFFSLERGAWSWTDANQATRHALTGVVVANAQQVQGDPAGDERTKALAGGGGELQRDAVISQSIGAEASSNFSSKHCAHRAIE